MKEKNLALLKFAEIALKSCQYFQKVFGRVVGTAFYVRGGKKRGEISKFFIILVCERRFSVFWQQLSTGLPKLHPTCPKIFFLLSGHRNFLFNFWRKCFCRLNKAAFNESTVTFGEIFFED